MRRLIVPAAAGLLLVSLAACSPGGTVADPTSPSASARPPFATTTPGPIGPSGSPTDVPPARWDAIAADLDQRGVTGDPQLVSATAVSWPNGALGCPQPGMSYTQAVVEGMQVVVEVDGTTYDYRFGRSDAPLLCEA